MACFSDFNEACVCCTVDNVYRIVRLSQICDETVTEISLSPFLHRPTS